MQQNSEPEIVTMDNSKQNIINFLYDFFNLLMNRKEFTRTHNETVKAIMAKLIDVH